MQIWSKCNTSCATGTGLILIVFMSYSTLWWKQFYMIVMLIPNISHYIHIFMIHTPFLEEKSKEWCENLQTCITILWRKISCNLKQKMRLSRWKIYIFQGKSWEKVIPNSWSYTIHKKTAKVDTRITSILYSEFTYNFSLTHFLNLWNNLGWIRKNLIWYFWKLNFYRTILMNNTHSISCFCDKF